jgi:hypothetical protein
MLPDGGDTSPLPTEQSESNCLVAQQCTNCCAPQTQPRSTSERDSDASASINAPLLPDNRPPPAFAPSSVPYHPGTSAPTDPRNTPRVQPLTQQSTVSGAVGAGQPAANCGNVDGGPTQEMVASELEKPASPATTDDADARVTVPPGNTVNGEGNHPPTNGPNAYTPRITRTEDELRTNNPLLQSFTGAD